MQESHIHSLINILWYCHLDDSLKGEPGLVSNEGLQHLSEIKELDYLTHIVLRMFENIAVRKTKSSTLLFTNPGQTSDNFSNHSDHQSDFSSWFLKNKIIILKKYLPGLNFIIT